jgi:spore coat polysaccharide biosynthesis protein SpsF
MPSGRTVAVIQARMTSSRLPGKVLMDIGTQPALGLMLSRVQPANSLDEIVVATTVNDTDDPVATVCCELGVPVFRGDEHDVLGRMLAAAENAKADIVVRLTADCPVHDPAVIDAAVEMMHKGNWDYVSNAVRRSYPDGLDVEVMTIDALRKADKEAVDPRLREHVTLYINGRRPAYGAGDFACGELVFDADFSHVRWTLDTIDDLNLLRELVSELPVGFTWLQALAVATKRPHLLGLPEQ